MHDILGLYLFHRLYGNSGFAFGKIEFRKCLLKVERELQFWMRGSTAFQSRMEDGINEFLNEIVLDSGTRMSLLFLSAYIYIYMVSPVKGQMTNHI